MTGRYLAAATLAALALASATQGSASGEPQDSATPTPAPVSRLVPGYLQRDEVPDSLLLVPAPPAAGSAALARDQAAAQAALALRGTPRWDLAIADAEIFKPSATDTFSCAAGVAIGPSTTPKLDALLRKTFADFGLAPGAVKRKYKRPRPFTENGQPICTPSEDRVLRSDGSYPSGHSAIGYGWGMILAEVFPDRATQLVARGRAFGDSRRVCNVHWLSDTEEGRVVATAVFARLQSVPQFKADLNAARAEITTLKPAAPTRDCAKEVAALAL